jgi:hypothetical protein
MIVTVQTRNGAQTMDVRSIEIVLSNGKRFDLRELTMFPGMLNVSADDTMAVMPRSANSFNIRSETGKE